MANKVLGSILTINRSIFTTKETLSRSYISLSLSRASISSSFSFFGRGPLVALVATVGPRSPTLRGFSTNWHSTDWEKWITLTNWQKWITSTPGDSLPAGWDFKHWYVSIRKPELVKHLTRDEIIDRYIKIFAQVVGSEDEARKKIYSVSTKYYFGFGALLSEELSDKLEGLPEVGHMYPDFYRDDSKTQYPGEPFINGQAVPYDPKYHESYLKLIAKKEPVGPEWSLRRQMTMNKKYSMRRESSSGQTTNYGNMGGGPNNSPNFQTKDLDR